MLPSLVERRERSLAGAIRTAEPHFCRRDRVGCGIDELGAIGREGHARHVALAADNASGRRLSRGIETIDVNVALIFRHDKEPGAVRRPQWPLRLKKAGTRAVQSGGEALRGSACGRQGKHLNIAARFVQVTAPQIGDPGAIRRICGGAQRASRVRELLGLPPVSRHLPQVDRIVIVPIRMASGGENHRVSVRRPGRIVVVPVPIRQLTGFPLAIGRHDKHVPPPVVDESLAIEFVLHRGDDPSRFRQAAFGFILGFLPSPDAGGKGQSRAVGRPRETIDAVGEGGETDRLAAIGRHHIELRLVARRPRADESQPRAVRRPARFGIASRPGGKSLRLAALCQRQPDIGEIFIALGG